MFFLIVDDKIDDAAIINILNTENSEEFIANPAAKEMPSTEYTTNSIILRCLAFIYNIPNFSFNFVERIPTYITTGII